MPEPLTDLAEILASLEVVRRGDYVYALLPQAPQSATVLAVVNEDEGTTVILDVESAARLGLDTSTVFTCLTLQVHSALESVGLTAAVSATLGDHGIPCNVLAGYYHDHILVPAARAGEAQRILANLSA